MRSSRDAVGWPDLVAEFDQWSDAGRIARLWWRDDDAVTATERLDDLLRLSGCIPLALAVVPALAGPELAAALANRSSRRLTVLQHGWQHADHSGGHGRKSEYPDGRPAGIVAAEVGAGWARLQDLFGVGALPVFVPPWNRMAEAFLPLLPRLGFAAVSALASSAASPMPRLDVHVDLVAWRDGRRFVGETAALARLIDHLRAARCSPGGGEPIGILTHHLVMDRPTANFLALLIALTENHRAVRWAGVADLL